MAEARKLLAEFAELVLPERNGFTSSWNRFFEVWRKAPAGELKELNGFLSANLPVCFYVNRLGQVEFLGGDLLARRARCFAWCFKHLGAQKLSVAAREWCRNLSKAQAAGALSAIAMEDVLSAKFAVRGLLKEQGEYDCADSFAIEHTQRGTVAAAAPFQLLCA